MGPAKASLDIGRYTSSNIATTTYLYDDKAGGSARLRENALVQ